MPINVPNLIDGLRELLPTSKEETAIAYLFRCDREGLINDEEFRSLREEIFRFRIKTLAKP